MICLLHIVILNINTKTFPITTNISTQVESLRPLETDLGFKNVLGSSPEVPQQHLTWKKGYYYQYSTHLQLQS